MARCLYLTDAGTTRFGVARRRVRLDHYSELVLVEAVGERLKAVKCRKGYA
jgi:hypothetical protein